MREGSGNSLGGIWVKFYLTLVKKYYKINLGVNEMRWFLFLMASLWTIAGIFFLGAAKKAKEISNKLMKNLKAVGFVPLIIGILLIFSAHSGRRYPNLVIIIGLLALAKGFFFIFASEKKARPLIDWWLEASLGIYRLWGLIVLALGIFFFIRVA